MLNPGFGATELVLIAIVALIVVGPKDLPLLMRRIGQFTARMRGMAAEFRSSFDEMARQSELDELRKEVEAMRRGQFVDPAEKAEVDEVFREIDESLAEVVPATYAPVEYAEAASLPPAEPEAPPSAAEARPGPKPKPKPKPRARKAEAKPASTPAEATPKRAPRPRTNKASQA